MMPDNVTLIVKAPNQQIDDQSIQCQSSWTVGQLKGHLAEVYPSKPSTEDQKIIYSGQLLDDNTVLKDVLRTYESQIAHTMHLVCAPKRMAEKQNNVEDGRGGLRRRNVESSQPNTAETGTETTRPETRQNDQNHTVEMQNYLNSFASNYGRVPPYPNYSLGEGYLPVPGDPASMANHMMMMQQAYLQYMQQYANMWQATANASAPAPPGVTPREVSPAPAAAPTDEAAPAPAPAPAPPADDLDEALAPRDWLDHLYTASRMAILFSLVYLYGSPARLLLVLFLVAAGYLHQIGFFRDLLLNQQNNVNQLRDRDQPDMNQPNQPTQPEQQPANANQLVQENEQSLFSVTWMIFTTFLSSLIPETN